MRDRLSRLIFERQFPAWSAPLAFLGALVLAFGIMIPTLGIYQDDWLFFYNYRSFGASGILEFMLYDGTPFASYLINSLFSLLGYSLIGWHTVSLLARWLTVVVFWLIFRRLWPANPRQTFLVALIFALHPFFTLQPLAVTFSHIWVAYFFIGLSLYWMILSVVKPERYWLYTALSILAGVINILSGEYFAGFEFVRPVFLWFALAGRGARPRERTLQVLRYWLPYLLGFGIYAYWRFFIFEVPIRNRNNPVLVETLLRNPVSGLIQIITNLIPDTVLITLSSWYKLLEPEWLDFTERINQAALALALVAGALAFYYLSRQKFDRETSEPRYNWHLQAIFLGLVILVFGLIPPYVGGLFLNQKNALWNSRFGLASLAGASLVVVALLDLLVTSRKTQNILLAIFVGLSAGWHFRYTNDYRRAWDQQTNFYRQLLLRVPSIEPGTAIYSDGEILSRMGDYPTAYAINTLYTRPADLDSEIAPLWFYVYTTNFNRRMEDISAGTDLVTRHRSVVFEGDSRDSLVITFESGQGQCLHVIRPKDRLVRTLPDLIRDTAGLSRLNRIHPESGSSLFLEQAIGFRSADDWCSHYQRADLARQLGNWEEILAEWDSAQGLGLEPNDSFEYIPFIEAFIHTNDFDKAVELSNHAARTPAMQLSLCDLWASWSRFMPENTGLAAAKQEIDAKFNCADR